MPKTKHHKWLVTLKQLKAKFGDDLEAITVNYAHHYSMDRDALTGYLGDRRDLPMTDATKADAISNSDHLKKMVQIDIDFHDILKHGPDSPWLAEVKEWYRKLVKNENA